jgi:hypothetical protein
MTATAFLFLLVVFAISFEMTIPAVALSAVALFFGWHGM